MSDFDPAAEENEWIAKTLTPECLKEILAFCDAHKVEVLFCADLQYACYIDYKDGNGHYGSGLTPLYALWHGITMYKKERKL